MQSMPALELMGCLYLAEGSESAWLNQGIQDQGILDPGIQGPGILDLGIGHQQGVETGAPDTEREDSHGYQLILTSH